MSVKQLSYDQLTLQFNFYDSGPHTIYSEVYGNRMMCNWIFKILPKPVQKLLPVDCRFDPFLHTYFESIYCAAENNVISASSFLQPVFFLL